jgi:hypothetical protein
VSKEGSVPSVRMSVRVSESVSEEVGSVWLQKKDRYLRRPGGLMAWLLPCAGELSRAR